MSGRLGVLGALNRPRTLNPLPQSENNCDGGPDTSNSSSASYSKLERELKMLKLENTKLRSELDETRVTLKQLISENSHEKFDERRINLLKFQLIQLERQIAILSEALGCRHAAVLEVENTMSWLADKLRTYIAADVKGPLMHIARSDLTSMTEVLESARIKLFKALEDSEKDTVGRDLIFLNPFLGGKYKPNEQLSLLDISLERMDYINLRHVAQLESKLCRLYKELIRVHEHLQNIKPTTVFAGYVSCAERDRLEAVLLGTCVMLRDSADDLMALSLLCPSSPWPVLKRPVIKQVPIERVIAALPALPRSKQEEVTHIIEASLHTSNHHQFLLTKEITMLKEELAFHRSVYDLQMQYSQALIEAVRKGYGEFEASARSLICKPLTDILDAYKNLKNTASEDAFRDFLIIMKTNEEQLTSVVETLISQNFESDESGSMAFSKFEEEFMSNINSLVRACQNERDAAMKAHKIIQKEQSKKDLELQHLIEALENKYEKIWTPKVSLSSEPKPVCDNKDLDKDRKHEIPRENSTREISHLVEYRNSKYSETTCNLRQHKDVMVLQGIPSDGDEAFKFKHENYNLKNESSFIKEPVGATKCSGHDSDKSKKIIWKPDQEWIHDFSGQSNKAEVLRSDLPQGNSCEITCQNKEYSKNNSQLTTNLSTNEKPGIKPRKSEYKMKKPLSYEPKLSVASRTLKLKCSGNLSKTDVEEWSGDSSLSKKGESDLELDTLLQCEPQDPVHPNSEGNISQSTRTEKHTFWR